MNPNEDETSTETDTQATETRQDFFSKFKPKDPQLQREAEKMRGRTVQHGKGSHQDPGDESHETQETDDKETESIVNDKREETESKSPFIKKQIERARAAEAKAAEADKKLNAAQATLAEKETKIRELEEKINSGDLTRGEEKQANAEIDKLKKQAEKAERVIGENAELKKRLANYDIQFDEDYQREFVVPINNGFREIVEIIGENAPAMAALEQAVSLNTRALNEKDPKKRAALENQRDEMLSDISEGLPRLRQNTFAVTITELIKLTKRQRQAMGDPERAIEIARENAQKARQKEEERILGRWNEAFEEAAKGINFDTPADFEKEAKRLGIDFDVADDEQAARAALTQDTDMNATVRVLNQGAKFKKVLAVNKVLSAQLAEAQEVIKKLRNSGSGGGTFNHGSAEKKESRSDFHSRFAPGRR